jgi:hypothetical protein
MRRFIGLVFAALMLAAPVLLTPTEGLAKGGYVRLPEPKLVRAGLPIPSDLGLSPDQMLGGCGTRRSRDPATHKCRGPADFGN